MTNWNLKSTSQIFNYLSQQAQQLYNDATWAGLQPYSLEWLLAQLVSENSSLIQQYLDLRATNAYLSTAQVYRDALNISDNIGLVPGWLVGATDSEKFTANGTQTVTVPIGTNVSDSNSNNFCTTSQLVLNSGNSYSATVNIVYGKHVQVTYYASGDITERIQLNQTNVLQDYLQVSVNGTTWTMVTTLFGVNSTSTVFRLRYNDDGTAYLLFGDGTYGSRLPADAQVVIDVFYGGGNAGNNIAAGQITTLVDTFAGSSTITAVTNVNGTSGGKAKDSIPTIQSNLPSAQRSTSGLINKQDIPGVIQTNLPWVANAIVTRTFANLSGVQVPIATVYAYPYSTTVSNMSNTQQTQLSTFCSNRGELGVVWNNNNAVVQPVQLQAKVKLANRNLIAQKQSEIINALVGISGTSPFVFDQLSFNSSYTKDQIINTIKTVQGVVSVEITSFSVVPQPYSFSGSASNTGTLAAVALGSQDWTEDGYFEFSGTSTSAANVFYNRPVTPNVLGTNFVRDTSRNWQLYDLQFGSASFNTLANDTKGPYVRTDTNGRVEICQLNNIWTSNQFSGSTWRDRCMLKLSWQQDGFQSSSYYHISGSTYKTITTQESASSPVFGSKITGSLSASTVSNVEFTIFQDNSQCLYMSTPIGTSETVLYNDINTLYLGDSAALTKVPVNETSFIKFSDGTLGFNGSSGSYFSAENMIRCSLSSGFLNQGDNIQVYITNTNSNNLSFKLPQSVFTLSQNNIGLTFV